MVISLFINNLSLSLSLSLSVLVSLPQIKKVQKFIGKYLKSNCQCKQIDIIHILYIYCTYMYIELYRYIFLWQYTEINYTDIINSLSNEIEDLEYAESPIKNTVFVNTSFFSNANCKIHIPTNTYLVEWLLS